VVAGGVCFPILGHFTSRQHISRIVPDVDSSSKSFFYGEGIYLAIVAVLITF